MHTASQALAIERQASAQPSLAERVSRPKTRAILGLMRLNFLSVAKIEEAAGRALRDPAVKAALEAQGLEPAPSTPAALQALMQEDMARWSKVIKDTGARAE